MAPTTLTVPEKLLIAAASLQTDDTREFSAEELVVAAWTLFPDTFGLKGFDYPDSNRVFAEIMGTKPIRKRGLLEKAGRKMYRLTPLGLETASRLKRAERSSVEKLTMKRETVALLKKLMGSNAYKKTLAGTPEVITFYDACAFLGISPSSSSIELQGRVNNIAGLIALLRGAVADGSYSSIQHGGSTVTDREISTLLETYEFLLSKFANQLDTIRKRTDER